MQNYNLNETTIGKNIQGSRPNGSQLATDH